MLKDLSVDFVEVLKDIFKLNYVCLDAHLVIFKCEWIEQEDNKKNPTYVRDDANFLIVNFCHKLPLSFEPSSYFLVKQFKCFFLDDIKKLG
jgi:hypothetical protein